INRTVLADRLDTPPVIPSSLIKPVPVEPEPVQPEQTVRCYDCGQIVPAAVAVRRDVVIHRDTESFYGTAAPWLSIFPRWKALTVRNVSTVSRVDLCPECNHLRDSRERGWLAGCATGLLVLVVVLASAAGFLFLLFPEEAGQLVEAIRQWAARW